MANDINNLKPLLPASYQTPKALPSGPTNDIVSTQLSHAASGVRDAFAALGSLFQSYGLSSLAPLIMKYLTQGYGADTIAILLQETPEYKARFAGNQERLRKGLQVLTPAEYLSTEASYRQALYSAGLDPALMNETNYAEWISNDISPTELQNRVNMAVTATVNAPPQLTQAWQALGVKVSDLAGMFLNDQNPLPELQTKLTQAQIMSAGYTAGVPKDQIQANRALAFAQAGVTYDQAKTGYQKVAEVLPMATALNTIFNSRLPINEQYGEQSAENEFLGNNAQATLLRQNLSNEEVGLFSGTGGTAKQSLSQQSSGNSPT